MASNDVYAMKGFDLTTPMRIAGGVALPFVLVPILTYLVFPELRNLRYVELVYYVSLSDLFVILSLILGKQPNLSVACWFQAIMSNAFALSSVFWTVVISYQLWLIVCTGRIIQNMTWLHVFCWGFPLFVTLLPLSTSTYGNVDDDTSWCFVRPLQTSPSFAQLLWELLAFYIWLWLSIFVMIIFLLLVFVKFRSMGTSLPTSIHSSLSKLTYYPFIIIACWWIPSFVDLSHLVNRAIFENELEYQHFGVASNVLPILQGLLLSIVFCTKNPIVRDRWRTFIASIVLMCVGENKINNSSSSSSSSGSSSSSSRGGSRNNNAAAAAAAINSRNNAGCVQQIRDWASRETRGGGGGDDARIHLRAEDETDYTSSSMRDSRQGRGSSFFGWVGGGMSISDQSQGRLSEVQMSDHSFSTNSSATVATVQQQQQQRSRGESSSISPLHTTSIASSTSSVITSTITKERMQQLMEEERNGSDFGLSVSVRIDSRGTSVGTESQRGSEVQLSVISNDGSDGSSLPTPPSTKVSAHKLPALVESSRAVSGSYGDGSVSSGASSSSSSSPSLYGSASAPSNIPDNPIEALRRTTRR